MNDFKVNFMMEYMFRIQDYFFCQLIGPMSDSNPFYPLILRTNLDFDREKKANTREDSGGSDHNSSDGQHYAHFVNKNTKVNLEQYKFCTGLDIQILNP